MRLGIAHHLGWAVAVTASADHRVAAASLAQLAAELPEPIVSMSLRSWPLDFPEDIAVQRRPPYDAQADSVMYRQVLAELAHARGWAVHLYDARGVESQAAGVLGAR